MSSNLDEKMKISFDWDNTISMSYLDEDSEAPKFIHQGYNQEFIDKMIKILLTFLIKHVMHVLMRKI